MRDPNPSVADALVGQTVNGLTIKTVLGQGGMGAVLLAQDERAAVRRAIKVIRSELGHDAEAQARFRHEALALSRLEHEHIVEILDFGQLPNGWLFLTMEYVAGPDLEQYVDHLGPLPLSTGLSVLRQLASAIAYAHRHGVVHRDLKPANIVLGAADPERLKVVDFGLAKLAADSKRSLVSGVSLVVGSPCYMSPEQAQGFEVGPPSDVYALAGVAYSILTGSSVFPDNDASPLNVMMAHCTKEPPRLTELRPLLRCPPRFEELLLACLDKQPQNRPRADELVANFDHLQAEACGAAAGSATSGGQKPRPATVESGSRLGEQLWDDPTELDQDPVLKEIHERLTAVMLQLARALMAYQSSPRLARLLDRYATIRSALLDLDAELAAVEARLAQASDPEESELRNQRTNLRVQRAGVQRTLWRQLQWVFDVVQAARGRETGSSSLDALSANLDALVARYQGRKLARPS